jgi:hypothetical protein
MLTFKGHNAYGYAITVRQRSLDGLVQFIEFAGVARPHQTFHLVARNVRSMLSSLATHGTGNPWRRKNHFAQLTDRPGNERDYDRPNVLENCIGCQDNDRSATDWLRQFSPPDLFTLHVSSDFQSEMSGSSPSSAACVSPIWVESRSVIAADSRCCQTAFNERAHIAALLCGEIPKLLLPAAE